MSQALSRESAHMLFVLDFQIQIVKSRNDVEGLLHGGVEALEQHCIIRLILDRDDGFRVRLEDFGRLSGDLLPGVPDVVRRGETTADDEAHDHVVAVGARDHVDSPS